ncbi:MAG: hypothetical protein KY466_03340 [Gemmatimonadetes bacterium]|nr:hypothetical protein [Gemmatimonadota bacterium]
MMTYARRRAATVFTLAIAAAVAGFTCDHPTEPELLADDSSLASLSGHRVEGVVATKGQGLKGVSITLKGTNGTFTGSTDEEGAFRLESVASGTYGTSARAIGVAGLPAQVVLSSLGSVEVDESTALGVDAPTHRLDVNVTIGGAPLPGARVYCTMAVKADVGDGRIAQGVQVMAGMTADNGVFETPLLPTSAKSTCNVYPLNNSWVVRFVVPVVTSDLTANVDVPGISYRGVLSAKGKAAGGQIVRLVGAMKGESKTGQDGAYDVKLAPGYYALALAGNGADGNLPLDFQLSGAPASGGTQRPIGSTLTEDLDLPVAMLTLSVTGVGGAAVAGATIDQVVQGASFGLGEWKVTNGMYRVSGTSGADGVLRLPMFPRADAVDLIVKAPEGTGLLDGVLTLESIAGDAAETLSLMSANRAPIAVAGGPYFVNEGGTVMLDGGESSDPDGDDLEYVWSVPGHADGAEQTMAVSFPDGLATYEAVLTVSDGMLSSSASAKIIVANVAPSVEAEPAGVVSGESFELAASFADPGADSWHWVVEWAPGVTAEGDLSEVGPFAVPSPVFLKAGEHTVRVTVSDEDGDAGSAEIVVTVRRLSVGLDILPGSSDNILSLNANGGSVPVAVLSAGSFDATRLDPASIFLGENGTGGVPVSVRKNGSYMASFEDVNGDGVADLMLHFDRTALISGLTPASTQLVLHGTMDSGIEVEGVDAIGPK